MNAIRDLWSQPALPRSARLGRDLRSAILVGVGLAILILGTLLLVKEAFVGLLAVAVAVATWELAGALRRGGLHVALPVLLVGGQAMVWLSWPFGALGLLVAFTLTVMSCLLWRMRRGAHGYLRDVGGSLFAAAYVPLFASFAAMLVVPSDGVGRVLSFMIVAIASDIGGYLFGVLFGRRPMAPSISPKKTWEGFVGSLLSGTAAGVLSLHLLLDAPWPLGVLFGVVLVVVATVGDLIESLVKRDVGVKDMGNLLPGHGGLMDRMDSLLPSAVVSWLVLTLLVPVR